MMEDEIGDDTNCNQRIRCTHERVDTGIGRLGYKRTSGYHPNYSIVETARILRRVLKT